MRKAERSSYTPIDFLQWNAAGVLVISPKFQRRGVWSRPARSFLIDTLLLGLPVPPLYLRVTQSPGGKGLVREVVDGQQRISAVLDYIENKYSLSRNIESPCAGKRFDDLDESQQDSIRTYSFICEVFYGAEDADILRIFARLNMHSVKLNAQELRNGKYFGHFKRAAYGLAFENLEFWRSNKIFTETAIARMHEAELTSELLIAQIDGLQDKKKSINEFYAKYDEEFPRQTQIIGHFRSTIDQINGSITSGLEDTEFRRTPLFYSLFCAVYHRLYRLPKITSATPAAGRLTRDERESLDGAVRKLSEIVSQARDEEEVPKRYEQFITACLRQTDNLRPRQTRLRTVYQTAFG